MRRPHLPLRRLVSPPVQVVAAGAVMVGGAALIALWMVGVMLIVAGLLLALDALLRETPAAPEQVHGHEDVLERYRRAR